MTIFVDITEHKDNDILCACYDCRDMKGYGVRVASKPDITSTITRSIENSIPSISEVYYTEYTLRSYISEDGKKVYYAYET